MSGKKEYLEQSDRDRRARSELGKLTDPLPEWVITISFYEALHLLEAVLAHLGDNGEPHNDHKTRNKLIKCDPRFNEIRMEYKKLFDISMWARYLIPDRGHHSPWQLNMTGISNTWLSKIQAFAKKKLSK